MARDVDDDLRRWQESEDAERGRCSVRISAAELLAQVPRISDIPEVTQGWLWRGRVPTGHITVVVGPQGAAKSYLIAEIASRVSNGDAWPDDPLTPCQAGETLVVSAEDNVATTIAPKLRACGVKEDKVRVLDIRRDDGRPTELDWRYIEAIANAMPDLKLLVIDPFAEALGARNDRRKGDLRVLLNQLARFAERRGIAIILVNATEKVSTGKMWPHGIDVLPFLEAGSRTIWRLEADPVETGRFLWLPLRGNLVSGRTGLAFTIESLPGKDELAPGKVVWDPEPVELKADDLRPVNRPITKVARAADWLGAYLEEGARTALEVRRDAALAGISRGALYEAKSRLGVLSVKKTDTANGGWGWRLSGVVEERRGSTLDPEFLTRFAAALRKSCEVQAPAAGGSDETGAESGDLPEDSKSLVPVMESEERSKDGVEVDGSRVVERGTFTPPGPPLEQGGRLKDRGAARQGRPAVAAEGGVGRTKPNRTESGDSPEDSKSLVPVMVSAEL